MTTASCNCKRKPFCIKPTNFKIYKNTLILIRPEGFKHTKAKHAFSYTLNSTSHLTHLGVKDCSLSQKSQERL